MLLVILSLKGAIVMKLGVLTVALQDLPFDKALAFLKERGVEMVEIGCGGYPGTAHCDPEILLNDEKALEDFKALLKKYNVEISALSCHGNPVHPDKAIAKEFASQGFFGSGCNLQNCSCNRGCRSIWM